jgi:hypothetical protein
MERETVVELDFAIYIEISVGHRRTVFAYQAAIHRIPNDRIFLMARVNVVRTFL